MHVGLKWIMHGMHIWGRVLYAWEIADIIIESNVIILYATSDERIPYVYMGAGRYHPI